ncbi:hypothetical protein [uncultured Desulfobulbus sp.]|uniref:hypothetical protein n=1 Tax=uncultured Desulfobulbus sp. TaxID=239745 RepID=UPI0029C62DC9|nr:hypothetical protein [uncultured Desulfobulbus sp.]
MISLADRNILRELASMVAGYAALPIQAERRDLWYKHNSLEKTRPVIFCDPENSWNEIIPQSSLICEDPLARAWEFGLRVSLFRCEKMKDDVVISPYFDVAHVHTQSDWGMHENIIGGGAGRAYTWDSPLKSYDDLNKLRYPEITVDYAATDRLLDEASGIFGDILTVRLNSRWWWSFGMTWTLAQIRGLEQMMLDMIDNPEGLHQLMAILRDGNNAKMDFLQENGLLYLNNDGSYVGSGGFGWTHELPQPDFDGKVRTQDIWGFAESQETVAVSPDMFEEFIFPYQLPLLKRFGLNCYGCCEPVDTRWRIIKQIPNLRRISVSPWSSIPKMAEYLEDKYILSLKPNPSMLAMESFNENLVRENLRQSMDQAKGCCLEVVMKDNHTLRNEPERAVRWVEIALEEAENFSN